MPSIQIGNAGLPAAKFPPQDPVVQSAIERLLAGTLGNRSVKPITGDDSPVDWELLRKQKDTLSFLINGLYNKDLERAGHLDGVLKLLESIQEVSSKDLGSVAFGGAHATDPSLLAQMTQGLEDTEVSAPPPPPPKPKLTQTTTREAEFAGIIAQVERDVATTIVRAIQDEPNADQINQMRVAQQVVEVVAANMLPPPDPVPEGLSGEEATAQEIANSLSWQRKYGAKLEQATNNIYELTAKFFLNGYTYSRLDFYAEQASKPWTNKVLRVIRPDIFAPVPVKQEVTPMPSIPIPTPAPQTPVAPPTRPANEIGIVVDDPSKFVEFFQNPQAVQALQELFRLGGMNIVSFELPD